MEIIKPLPLLPVPRGDQPAVVSALDDIRFALDDEAYAEFYWFAREYPRIYRYHLYHAEHRLEQIHANYTRSCEEFEREIHQSTTFLSTSKGRGLAWIIYWDFEVYLNTICSALDTLARIVGLFYVDQVPVSFSKLCAKRQLTGAVDILRSAQRRWVLRVKDYRDCFVHYTPVDNESFIHCVRYREGWEVRCSLPVNPNVRETDAFRFSRRTELLRYAVATYKNLRALDRQVGRAIRSAWRAGAFPRRTSHLFFVGPRQITRPNNGMQPTRKKPRAADA